MANSGTVSCSPKFALALAAMLTTAAVYAEPVDVIYSAENALYGAGYDIGMADGWMDDKLRSAIRQYQSNHSDLQATGNLDINTLFALGIVSENGAPVTGNRLPNRQAALSALGISASNLPSGGLPTRALATVPEDAPQPRTEPASTPEPEPQPEPVAGSDSEPGDPVTAGEVPTAREPAIPSEPDVSAQAATAPAQPQPEAMPASKADIAQSAPAEAAAPSAFFTLVSPDDEKPEPAAQGSGKTRFGASDQQPPQAESTGEESGQNTSSGGFFSWLFDFFFGWMF
ncbi:peptidoglycan-binding domain-containing protein [Marinobacter sp.]|uniref:peptidoglycan-binding domain-containing protein n=1 Tax=Marinobacter sp. TaxID=50741 RepID=UPI0019B17B73|nr:peptidoglycan-binding domain-containing protein [Marinobacter sp.]MBC7190823.1 peptidoglycan-binding protein [Marinobacter sp.]